MDDQLWMNWVKTSTDPSPLLGPMVIGLTYTVKGEKNKMAEETFLWFGL